MPLTRHFAKLCDPADWHEPDLLAVPHILLRVSGSVYTSVALPLVKPDG